MQNSKIPASVHRFHNDVAVYLGEGQTIYLSPRDAEVLAYALNSCAENIKAQPNYSNSSFGTCNMEFYGKIS